MKGWPLVLTFLLLLGCGASQESAEADEAPGAEIVAEAAEPAREASAVSGADVGYHNPKTGYSADYTLDVEYDSDGNVERITFPNGGWEDDFIAQDDNGDGTVTVTDEDGREFTVEAAEASSDE